VRTIAIINQKGGCGKTTTAINLGASLGRLGRRTLLVDLDPQGHCAAGLGVPESRIEFDSSDLLQAAGARGGEAGRMLWHSAKNLDLIPSRIRLAGLESPGSAFSRREGRERSLAQALVPLADGFDVCLIDCPPAIGLLTFNALVAADLVLVPVETGYFSLQGAARQLTTVRAVGRRLATEIRCVVLPTLHEPGLAVAEDLLEELRRRFGKRLLPVTIHRDTALREAASFGRPVCEHAPHAQGTRDYASLASVLVETESLLAGAPDDDWADIDAAAATQPPRPTRPGGPPTHHHTPEPADFLITGDNGSTIATSTGIAEAGLSEVVVTLSTGEIRSGLTPRVAAPSPTPTRAEDFARRAAQIRHNHASAPPPTIAVEPIPRPMARPTKPAFGPRVTDHGVEFVQPRALGRSVCLAGKFSQWQPVEMRLDPDTNTHTLRLRLPPGRHEYRLVVDNHWIADPYNTDWVLNEFGEPHSIVEVQAVDTPPPEETRRGGPD
jgi:chromosome partitioning protein